MVEHLFYRQRLDTPPAEPIELPPRQRAREEDPRTYVADKGLVHAVDAALLLGRPLLVTGEPGTGKTQLAASVALQLGLGTPLTFVAKSVSQAQDLFYTFNALERFKASAAEGQGDARPADFIRYNALGAAILYANPPAAVQKLMPSGTTHPGQRRSVVLIDEVDKAPRDFPNDILSELEHMEFRIPQLGGEPVRADPAWHPVVIITSNSERGLPDPFLRRCIYYDIPFPDRTRLDEILRVKLGKQYEPGFASDALELLDRLRQDGLRLSKKPSTAELIGWMNALLQRAAMIDRASGKPAAAAARNPLTDRTLALQMLGVLVKSREDLKQAAPVVEAWAKEGTSPPAKSS